MDITQKQAAIYDHCRSYLEKYNSALKDDLPKNLEPNGKYENYVWTMWLQGENQAPGIVKTCLKSIKKYCSDRKVVVLDEESLEKYIELPSYIMEKYKQDRIIRPIFADIVRYCLLYKYGGTWIDSTVLMTDKIPKRILKEDLFLFHIAKGNLQRRYFLTANWFIHAKPGNVIMKDLIKFCFAYWRQENKPVNYFLDYFFFSMAVKNDIEARKIFNKMMYYPERLHFYPRLSKPFSKKLLVDLKEIGELPFHKLTYRLRKKYPGSLFEYLSQENVLD